MKSQNITIEYFYVIIAGILSGVIVFGGRVFANLGLSALEVSIIPFSLSAIILSPFVLTRRNFWITKQTAALLVLYGLVSAGTIIGQYTSLYFGIPVAIVVLLLYTQPLWTTLICKFFLKENVTLKEIIACAIVLIGMLILVNPFIGAQNYNIIGLALAVMGGISLSGWIIVGSLLSKKGVQPISSQFFGVTFSVLLIALLVPLLSNLNLDKSLISFNLNFSLSLWIWLIIFSVIAVTLNQILYLKGVKKVSTVTAGIIMLLEPITGALLAVVFLNQPLTLNILIGGALILFANYLVLKK